MPWLLEDWQPNLHWRVLVELVRRPPDSPAVARALGGANAAEPVASLLEDLHPDGTWATRSALWTLYRGPGWRLVAAVQLGAEPSDPRLQAAAARLLETAPGESGFSLRQGDPPVPCLTARVLEAMARLGRCDHPRCVEALAWLEEEPVRKGAGTGRCARSGHLGPGEQCAVAAVAVLSALTHCARLRLDGMRQRAVEAVLAWLGSIGSMRHQRPYRLAYPNLLRTDAVEALWALALAGEPCDNRMTAALRRVQLDADANGRWEMGAAVPSSLPMGGEDIPRPGRPCHWITLHATVALLAYAGDAGLKRLFPQPPPAG
jgi:hypothetical protein